MERKKGGKLRDYFLIVCKNSILKNRANCNELELLCKFFRKEEKKYIYIYIYSSISNTILFVRDVLIMVRFDSVEHVTGITLASISIDVVVAQRSIVCLGVSLHRP